MKHPKSKTKKNLEGSLTELGGLTQTLNQKGTEEMPKKRLKAVEAAG